MNRRGTIPPILLSLLAIIIAGCASTPKSEAVASSVTAYQSKIRDIVADPARAEMLVQLVDQAAAEVNAAETEAAAFAEQFQRLNADYDATREQFTNLLTAHRQRRHQFAQSLLSIRSKMVASTTPLEWESLSKVRTKVLETIFKAELPADTLPALAAASGGAPC
jgi:outer membrane murein-binding lipoprotein Lpp